MSARALILCALLSIACPATYAAGQEEARAAGEPTTEVPVTIPCEGDDCQGPAPAPDDPVPITATVQGAPNPPVRFAKKPKPDKKKVRHGRKHVKKQRHGERHHGQKRHGARR